MASRQNPEWRQALVESYPDLFHPVGPSLTAPGLPAVGDGWRDLLERACARVRAAIRLKGGSFRVTQICEKYGTLRFCWEGTLSREAAGRVEEAIDLAEARSATTCDVCGELGALRAGDWLATRCDVHAEGRAPAEEGIDDLRVERMLVGGRWRTTFRFYDRNDDRFVEASDPHRE